MVRQGNALSALTNGATSRQLHRQEDEDAADDRAGVHRGRQDKVVLGPPVKVDPPDKVFCEHKSLWTSSLVDFLCERTNRDEGNLTKDKADDQRRRKVDARRGRDKLESGQGDG